MHINPGVRDTLIICLVICSIDWLFFYFNFYRRIKPSDIENSDNQRLIKGYEKIHRLYNYYENLGPNKFKFKKLDIKSIEVDTPFLNQLLDLTIKLIFTIGLAIMGSVAAVNSSVLGFVSKNDEMKNKDYLSWVKQINDLLENMKNGIDSSLLVLLCALGLFIFASNHFFINTTKQNIINRHLTIIDEIEKSNKKT